MVISQLITTHPENNIAPENGPPGKGDSYWKPPFLGAMFVLGSVVVNFQTLQYLLGKAPL